MTYRILVLQSVEDSITFRREMRIKNSPLLKGHEFEHVYAIELSQEHKNLPTGLMMMEIERKPLDNEGLLNRLKVKVESFKPDILVIHSGFVFHRFPKEILSVLESLKSLYPSLRMGFQERFHEYDGQLGIFENSDEMNDLIYKIF